MSSSIELPPSTSSRRKELTNNHAEPCGGCDDDEDDEELLPMMISGRSMKSTSNYDANVAELNSLQKRRLRRNCLEYIATIRYLILSSSSSSRKMFHAIGILTVVLVLALYMNDNNNKNAGNDFPPFCDPTTGKCGETPWIASPRTIYSAWTQEQLDLWWTTYHAQQRHAYRYLFERHIQRQLQQHGTDDNTTETVTTTTTTSSQQRRPIVLLGDSITESWNGTGLGILKKRCLGTPQVLHDKLVKKGNFDPLILAVSGDQTQHLLYRLETLLSVKKKKNSNDNNDGDDVDIDYYYHADKNEDFSTKNSETVLPSPSELRSELENEATAIFVLMIGTNNLGSGELPGPTSKGVLAVAEYILAHSHPSSRLLLFHLLPRGDGGSVLPDLCPPRCDKSGNPFRSFMPAINQVNNLVQQGISSLQEKYPFEQPSRSLSSSSSSTSRIGFVDCGSSHFLKIENNNMDASSEEEVRLDLMPDRLHPNAKGMELIADCILDFANSG